MTGPLYMSMSVTGHGKVVRSTVYHLRKNCPLAIGPNAEVVSISKSTARLYVKDFGIKRICLTCRKAVEKGRPSGIEKRRA